jgi:beta-glucosidase
VSSNTLTARTYKKDKILTPETTDRVALTTGAGYWATHAVPDIGLRSLRLADGPHGLRVQNDDDPDHLGIGRSARATCFPPAVALASSWDQELITRVGAALGAEARAAGVDVILGPGMNLKRSPLCGRNFEYYSEDPFLSGVLAGAAVSGIQSQSVAACIKHFAANNQETDRQRVSADMDERTLREIYLRGFQIAIRNASPWTIMTSYNRINGTYASEDSWLLTTVLRDEWGFDGVVISDWGAVHNPVASISAGLDLRMPGRQDDPRPAAALASGELSEESLNRVTEAMVRLADRTRPDGNPAPVDYDAHYDLVRRAAAESAVLLTNDGTLPLSFSADKGVVVVGELAQTPRFQGAGSSLVNPYQSTSILDALSGRASAAGTDLQFAPGYALDGQPNGVLLQEAVDLSRDAGTVILVLGLPPAAEAEGRDRETLSLPQAQIDLLRDVAGATQGKLVVALMNGSAVTTNAWRDDANAIVEFWLTGEAQGDTVADVLLGDVNPSGKLAETVPVRIEDTPAYLNFPGEHGHVRYGEGIYVGYRYYDARGLEVEYPFGHGLSYTQFTYSSLTLTPTLTGDPTAFAAEFTVTNTGDRAGAEVAQLYVTDRGSSLDLPPQELRGWSKIRLQAGESRRIVIAVTREDMQHWSPAVRAWIYEGGLATVSIGSSSRDIRLSGTAYIPGHPVKPELTPFSSFGEWLDHATAGGKIRSLLDERGGIRGRAGDLYNDEGARASILSLPMQALVEFPGVPLTQEDLTVPIPQEAMAGH